MSVAPAASGFDTSDPKAAWAAVFAALETSNAWAWLDQVESAGGGERDGVLQLAIRPKPAAAGVARLATPDRLDRLAAQATTILGTRVRVRLDEAAASTATAPAAAGRLGSRVAAESAEANAQRQEAMSQPLVRAVLSVFPDAVLVGARKRERKADPGVASEDADA